MLRSRIKSLFRSGTRRSRFTIIVIGVGIVLTAGTASAAVLTRSLPVPTVLGEKLGLTEDSSAKKSSGAGGTTSNSAAGAKQGNSAAKGTDTKKSGSTSTNSSSTGSSTSGGTQTSPSTPAPTPAPISAANAKFGMSAPTDKWNERLAQVGPTNINYRRIFRVGFDDSLTKVSEAINAGMTPIISWKTNPYSWAQVGSGAADADLQSLVTRLNAIPGKKILAVHHEPAGDGTAQDFVAMQLRALPILSTANDAEVGIIANGWWWSAQNQGYSDSEIAEWIPTSLKNVCDFIGADTYQDENLTEDGSVKASRMAAWAKRTGSVSALGIGEFNGFTASSITNVMNVVKAEPLFKWAAVWNSGPSGLGTPLEGDRLQAFIVGKSTPNPT